MRLLTALFYAGLVLAAVALLWIAKTLWPPEMGIDFAGGVQLVYQVAKTTSPTEDETNNSLQPTDWPSLISAVSARLNPARTNEIIVRPHGQQQIEIVVPQTSANQAKRIEQVTRLISAAGVLELHIVANRNDPRHQSVITQAEVMARDPEKRLQDGS